MLNDEIVNLVKASIAGQATANTKLTAFAITAYVKEMVEHTAAAKAAEFAAEHEDTLVRQACYIALRRRDLLEDDLFPDELPSDYWENDNYDPTQNYTARQAHIEVTLLRRTCNEFRMRVRAWMGVDVDYKAMFKKWTGEEWDMVWVKTVLDRYKD